MSERARAAIFNMIFREVVGAKVLDAFAGTGALGLEALSRGAESVVFVERDAKAVKILKENVELLGVGDEVKVVGSGLGSWLAGVLSEEEEFDVVFSDPPYIEPQWNLVIKLSGAVRIGGLFIISRTKAEEVLKLKGFEVLSSREYAEAGVDIYERVF